MKSEVLLLRRRKDDFLPGIYEMPGGALEPNESFQEAILREVKEETGLEVRKVNDYLGSFDYEDERGEKTRVFNYAVEVSGPFHVELSEHDEYVWVTKNNLSQLSLTDPVYKILNAYWFR
jgi:8-oxo-dGTP diphosphatase